MRISCILTLYDEVDLIFDALSSIDGQNYPEVEIIVIDDASSEVTNSFMQRLRLTYPGIIYHRNEFNMGVSASRNVGLRLATGSIIQILDHDDILLPGKWERQVPILGGRVDVVYCDYIRGSYVDPATSVSATSWYLPPHAQGWGSLYRVTWFWGIRYVIPAHAFIFRNPSHLGLSFPESLRVHEDLVFWLKLFTHYRTLFIPEVLCSYRARPSSVSATISHEVLETRAHSLMHVIWTAKDIGLVFKIGFRLVRSYYQIRTYLARAIRMARHQFQSPR